MHAVISLMPDTTSSRRIAMSLWQRVVKAITPSCGHELELESLKEALALAAENLRHTDKRIRACRTARAKQWLAFRAERRSLRAALEVLATTANEREKHHGDEVHALNNRLQAVLLERDVLAARLDAAEERASELLEQAEETTGRITELEQLLRENGIDPHERASTQAQSPLFSIPEGGGEMPEVIYDKVLRLPFGLIGVYLDGDRRRSWVIEAHGKSHKVPVKDKEFLARVGNGETTFRHGTAIIVDVHVVTHRIDGKVIPEYVSIEKVVQLVQPDEDVDLSFPDIAQEEVTDASTVASS
jgi:hypothetical protein